MSKKSIFCIALSRGRAGRIVLDLKEAAFSNTEISALFLDQSAKVVRAALAENSVASGESAIQPAEVIYGVMAWIAAVGFRIIPGADPIIAAGPISTALGDETVNSIADGLTDFGIPQERARHYENKVKDGHILISVHTETLCMSERVREIFSGAGAEDIYTTAEVSLSEIQSRNAYGISGATFA
jgi:hypothetical protein